MTTVVAQVRKPANTLRHRREPEARGAKPRILYGAAKANVRFALAVQVLVMPVIVAGECPNLDEVLGGEPGLQFRIRHDIP